MSTFEEQGIVVSLRAHEAIVRITPQGSCPDAHPGCPVRVLAEAETYDVSAYNPVRARVGQRVRVKVDSPHQNAAVFLAFVLPVALLFAGCWVGGLLVYPLGVKAGYAEAAGAIVGLLTSFGVMGVCNRFFYTRYSIVGEGVVDDACDASRCSQFK